MIELIDITLSKKLKDMYGMHFYHVSQSDDDLTRFKELSERKGLELDLPLGAFNREASTFDDTRYNLQAQRLGQNGSHIVNHDRTIGKTTQFVPVDLNYKLRFYSYKMVEAINFERKSWFELHHHMLSVMFPVSNGYNIYKMPIIIESHTEPEEAVTYRKSKAYRQTINIVIKGWIVEIRDVKLAHQILADILCYNTDTTSTTEEMIENFYDGTRLWD